MKTTWQTLGYALSRASLCLLALTLASCGSSGSDISCGTGTVLDDASDTCVAEVTSGPDFNRVINDVGLGDFTLTMIDVPDVLVPGSTEERELTIKNNTAEAKPVTTIRMALSSASTESAQTYLTNVVTGYNWWHTCSDACWWAANNGKCEDGLAGSAQQACYWGQDCGDCGPRKNQVSCGEGGTCADGYACDRASNVCHLQTSSIASIVIRDLQPGETRTLKYTVGLPYLDGDVAWSVEDRTLLFAVNEQWMMPDANDSSALVPNPAQPKWVGVVDLEHAAAATTAGTVALRYASEAIQITQASLDSAAFEIDTTRRQTRPIATITAKMLAKRVIEGPTHVNFKLSIAGGEYELDMEHADGVFGHYLKLPQQCETQSNCDELAEGHRLRSSMSVGTETDLLVSLHLGKQNAYRPLVAAARAAANAMGEVMGEIVMTADGNGSSSETRLPVVFMVPQANQMAADNDSIEPPPSPLNDGKYASDLAGGTYPDVDHLTPTYYKQIGSDWLGIRGQIRNLSSKQYAYGAAIKQQFLADNYVKADILTLPVTLLEISGSTDWSSQRLLRENRAQGQVIVPATSLAAQLTGMNTLLSFEFSETLGDEYCADDAADANVERCMLLGAGGGAAESDFGDVSINYPNIPEATKKLDYEKKKEKLYCYGPVCFRAALSISAELGIDGSLGFFRDTSEVTVDQPRVRTGLEATLGVWAKADATAEGTIELGPIGGAGFVGTVNIITAKITPTLQVGLEQELDPDGSATMTPCWMRNNGYVTFSGPASLSMLSGSAKIEVFFGPPPVDVGLFTINLRYKVVDFTLVEWDAPIDKSWMLWHTTKRFRGGSGLCPAAEAPDSSWQSPVACTTTTGARGYCPASSDIVNQYGVTDVPNVKRQYQGAFYLGASGCGHVVVDGSLEPPSGGEQAAGGDYLLIGEDGRPGENRIVMRPIVSPANVNDCAVRRNAPDAERQTGEQWLGGSVACGTEHNYRLQPGATIDSTYGEFSQSQLADGLGTVFSGDFNNTRLRFCGRTPGLNKLTFAVITDQDVESEGVTLKLELDEGQESAIYSDDQWTVAKGTLPVDDDGDAWNTLDWDRSSRHFRGYAQEMGVFSGTAPWYAGATAPFDATDAATAQWIWAAHSDAASIPAETVYFRRPFMAAKDSYTGHVRCDDNCTVYLDGAAVATVAAWDSLGTFTINTQPGAMHLITVQATNTGGGSAGMAFMMK